MDPSAELQAREALGRVLAGLRNAAGYKQAQFAPLTGYSRSTLANVETGRQRAPRSFWIRCDSLLTGRGRLTEEYDRLEAARREHKRQEAEPLLAHGERPGASPPKAINAGPDQLGWLVDEAADDAFAEATFASTALDGQSLADALEQVADIARGYANRPRWETFIRARRGRDLARHLAARTRRPTDLMDTYLVASLANALMASAAFDLARWSAATRLTRAASTFADLSGHPSAIGWARGLLATLLNWHNQPDHALQEIELALTARPERASQYRLHCIAARAHAMRGDRISARDALHLATRHRPGGGPSRDLLHDELAGEFRFDDARASACAGAAWLQLRDGVAAEHALTGALAAYAASPSRDRPSAPVHGARADLAAARLLRNDLGAASEALVPVFDLGPEQRISVLTGRLTGVQALLRRPRWQHSGTALTLRERIDDWLVTARPSLSGDVS